MAMEITFFILGLFGLGVGMSILLYLYFQKSLEVKTEKNSENFTKNNAENITANETNKKNNRQSEPIYPKYFFEMEENEKKRKQELGEELKVKYEYKKSHMQTDLYSWLVLLMAVCYSIPAIQLVMKQEESIRGKYLHFQELLL